MRDRLAVTGDGVVDRVPVVDLAEDRVLEEDLVAGGNGIVRRSQQPQVERTPEADGPGNVVGGPP